MAGARYLTLIRSVTCDHYARYQRTTPSIHRDLTNYQLLLLANIDAILSPEFWIFCTSTPPSSEQHLWPICLGSRTTFSSVTRTLTIRTAGSECFKNNWKWS